MNINHCSICGATDGVVFDRDGQQMECKNCIRRASESLIGLKLDEAREKIESIEVLLGGIDANRNDAELTAKFLALLGSAAELSHLWHHGATQSFGIREQALQRGDGLVEEIEIGCLYECGELLEESEIGFPLPAPDRPAILDGDPGDGELFEDSEFGPGGYSI